MKIYKHKKEGINMIDYEALGIKKVINAAGTYTVYGGSLVLPEVIKAMEAASKYFVEIDELLVKTGKYIANLVGAEAALITAGAAAGLTLSSAACIAGSKPENIKALPNTNNMKNEIIIMRSHRNPYDSAMVFAGARFAEIGNAIETHPWELKAAISEKTAAVAFFVQSAMLESSLNLDQVIEIAHSQHIPVIVDAAAELPPFENLKKFTSMGADIVLFSGGKDFRGPQSSGLMIGKKDIVDICRLHGYPNHAIGRPMKLDKETIMGFVAALESYLREDHKQRIETWKKQVNKIEKGLKDISSFEIFQGYPHQPLTQPAIVPRVYIKCIHKKNQLTKEQIAQKLYQGNPRIAVVVEKNYLTINPHMLKEGEEDLIVKKIREIVNKYGKK